MSTDSTLKVRCDLRSPRPLRRISLPDERNGERRAGLRAERRTTLHALHTSLKNDENKFWEEKANEVEEAGRRGESHGMFAAVNMLKGMSGGLSRSSTGIRDENGVVISHGKEKTAVFTRYFDKLYNPPTSADRQLLQEFEVEHGAVEQEDLVPISEAEVERALKAMRNRKAAGVCGIPPELLKYGGSEVTRQLTKLSNVILEEQRVPDDWKKAVIVPLFKNKGSRLDCGNYRGISLIPVPSKVFMRVLLNRIKPAIEERLREQQAGFRGVRSTVDQTFALRQKTEKR